MKPGHKQVLRIAVLGVASLCLSACATTSGPQSVGLSIVAPTDGSTVGVRTIELVGKVSPANAVVVVGHRTVRVRGGTFQQPVLLLRPLTHITIRARARGFRGSSTVLAVRYSPKIFPRHHAARNPGSSASREASASIARGEQAANNQFNNDFNRSNFVAGCASRTSGQVAYCGCVWDHLASAGFDAAKAKAMIASWRRTFRATGAIVYPPAFKKAILGCVSQITRP